MHSTTSSSGWIVFVSVLAAILASFKQLGIESLSWLWVLSPLWITALSLPALLLIVGLRCAFLALRSRKASPGPIPSRWKQWYDSFGNHPFVP
jgi:hypothetical protein